VRTNDKRFFAVILILAGAGVAHSLMSRPAAVLIPVLVLGTVFLLYKYPPGRWRRRGVRRDGPGRPPGSRPRNRRGAAGRVKLRVIPGRKKDDPPRH